MTKTQIFHILHNIFKSEIDSDHGLNIFNNPLISYAKHLKMHKKTLKIKYPEKQAIIQVLLIKYTLFALLNIILYLNLLIL